MNGWQVALIALEKLAKVLLIITFAFLAILVSILSGASGEIRGKQWDYFQNF